MNVGQLTTETSRKVIENCTKTGKNELAKETWVSRHLANRHAVKDEAIFVMKGNYFPWDSPRGTNFRAY